ncbi:hypothetical protein GJ496_011464 [Pomphorhynchus laevis]|nr:hypothetical protein GJ496_011464 [Pomphorhynchus laevis]
MLTKVYKSRILDPDGCLFSQRILSRNEFVDPRSKTSNIRSIFPCGDEMVAILDDRQDVWDNAINLILVPPFEFFRKSRNEQAVTDQLDQYVRIARGVVNASECDDDLSTVVCECMCSIISMVDRPCYLESLEYILNKLHSKFYTEYDQKSTTLSVHRIISNLRKTVLKNTYVKILPSESYSIRALQKIVIRLGGQISGDDPADVVIGPFLEPNTVRFEWLMDCMYYWRKLDFRAYTAHPFDNKCY